MINLKKSIFFIILGIIVTYVVIILYSDLDKFSKSLLSLNYDLIPIILFFSGLSVFIKGIRQKYLLQMIEIKMNFKQNMLIYLSGLSLLATPIGLGTAIRSEMIKNEHGHSRSKTLPIVIIEKFHDAISIIVIVLVFAALQKMNEIILIMIPIVIVVSIFYVVIKNKKILDWIIPKISNIKLAKKFLENILESKNSIDELMRTRNIFSILGISLVSWLFDAVAIYYAFLAFDINFDFLQTTAISLSSIIIGAVSFIPAGIGLTEASFIGLLLLYNVDISIASSLTLFVRLTTMWFTTVIGVIAIQFIRKSITK